MTEDGRFPRRLPPPAPSPEDKLTLSDLLTGAVEGEDETITVGEFVRRLSLRGLAPVVLVMALLNMFAVIPGSSAILGLPLLFLGLSLVIGARSLWLPARIRNQEIPLPKLKSAVTRMMPYVHRLEKLAHPRLWPGYDSVLDRMFGLFVLILGVVICLPIPFGNTVPAIGIALTALGFTARDGAWVVAGLFVATLAAGIVIGVAGAVAVAGSSIFGRWAD